ncbi:MAG: DegT/DnrJ/EryC1/StrS family aminotransferase [bacterium]
MKHIPFQFFDREYAELRDELLQVCDRFFESGHYILGAQVEQFETRFAKSIGVSYAAGVANGTDAITLAIKALDIEPGSKIITSAVSAYATVVGITQAGCIPVLVDIDPATGLIDHKKIPSAITTKTKAILPVHLYGQMVNMKEITKIASSNDLKVIEDCAQSYGATYAGKPAGAWGDAGAFSFYPTKNLGGYGDGGLVSINDTDGAARLRSLRAYGQSTRYLHDHWGINSRLDEFQAAMLRIKMQYAIGWRNIRNEYASRYRVEIHSVIHLEQTPNATHSYHLYVVTHPQRDALQAHLSSHGITSLIHYPIPQHKQKAFTYHHGPLPNAERFCDSILSLPLSAQMTKDEVDYVIEVVNMFERS